jgi:hypothetical protein
MKSCARQEETGRCRITKQARRQAEKSPAPRERRAKVNVVMNGYTKRRASRKRETVKKSRDTNRRERCVYFGQQFLGTFVENERSGLVLAWDTQRRFLGRFREPREAAHAISEAARAAEARKAATAKALEWVNRPVVDFVSGMPAHFLVVGNRR